MSDPVTAPELVEVVQAALAAHQRLTLALYPDYYCCTCGERSIEQPSAHQARAVLDALAKAGTMEFGVEREGEEIGYSDERHARASAAASVRQGYSARVVSRLALPWESAE